VATGKVDGSSQEAAARIEFLDFMNDIVAAWPDTAIHVVLEGRHTAHEQQAEARITYRFHPRFGEIVRVRRRLQRGGAAFLVVHQLDGTFACLPAWMTDEVASGFEISVEPHFPLDVLAPSATRSMRF